MGMWEIQLDGAWQKYEPAVGKALVEASRRGAAEYRFEQKGQPYVVDLKGMTQTNLKTGKTRCVREAGRGDAAYPGLPRPAEFDKRKRPHAPAPSAPLPSAPPAPITVHGTDVRPVRPAPAPVKTPPKVETVKRSGLGFKSGMAAGVVVAGGAALGTAFATGAIDGDDVAEFAGDAGAWISGAAEDAGEAIVDAAEDVADLVG